MPETPVCLGDLVGQDLAGYKLTTAYFLKIDHGLMGTHLAEIAETGEPAICLDKGLLRKVWEKLPRRKAKVVELTVLANAKFCFNLYDAGCGMFEQKPLGLLAQDEFERLVKTEEKPFAWAPGVMSFVDESDAPDPFAP